MPRAGLDADIVTRAGAALADEIGLANLSMNVIAKRLGVKAPSLYKHVDSLSSLIHRIAILATTELGDAIRDATQGRAGGDALAAAAHALRSFVEGHPGRYAATLGARPGGPDDPLHAALSRSLDSFSAVLRGYRLDPTEEIHALRMLRSSLHGFASLEMSDGFQMDTVVGDSFAWMITFIDQGLRVGGESSDTGKGDRDAARPVTGSSRG
ncbi:TetR/AcrR family transcriptional regulator [Cryobacterium sp. TMT2-18-3]|uniref:TetR/AcrR family transcriptional regulator n=1 Tax=Cryobacterium sp. TMT2-18-3 TaxID=1259250 RepID=UPI00106A7E0F|nr:MULTISPECIES: TetR/AcrR family transcriptional regulator [unclassified Cryobacterium]TFC29192.1 TetR/AcrR family transcriptional regulator [Cryobacterium sp. TMT2-18-2]TFC61558.1 TetR/AcrR family transcriptional regulator [Cryobacterium sp. TMT2-18-3]